MAESFTEVGKAAADIASRALLATVGQDNGGKFLFNIATDNVQVAREYGDVVVRVAKEFGSTAVKLAGIWALCHLTRPVIDAAIKKAFGDPRDDQNTGEPRPGSLHVRVCCFTDERFLEILADYESGRVKQRLETELGRVGLKVEGLRVEIENRDEVIERKRAIEERKSFLTEMRTEEEITETDSLAADVESKLFLREDKAHITKPVLAQKVSTTEGGVINIGNFILDGVPEDQEQGAVPTLTNDTQEFAFKTLQDIGLVDKAPQILEFSPEGVTFKKPPDVTIRLEKEIPPTSEHIVLNACYNPKYEKAVWEQVADGNEENKTKGVIKMKTDRFKISFFTYILARRGKLARILCYLNKSYTCCAYSLYRRVKSKDTIDISVVLFSEFVAQHRELEIKQLSDRLESGYVIGEKGFLKPMRTDRPLQLSLHFSGIEITPFLYKVDPYELDTVGCAVDYLEIAVKSPAFGTVEIKQMQKGRKKNFLWKLHVCEKTEQSALPDVLLEEQSAAQGILPKVIDQTTKLTTEEITRLSRELGVDWDNLAALLNIPYSLREEIRLNYAKYPSLTSKGERIFDLFNQSECFSRNILKKSLTELGRQDLANTMLAMENEGGGEQVAETATSQPDVAKVPLQNDTPLSSREIYRLGQHLVADWDKLAAPFGISKAEREDIRYSLLYITSSSRAEKILDIFNNMAHFSRKKLAECLEEIGHLELKKPVITGEWRR